MKTRLFAIAAAFLIPMSAAAAPVNFTTSQLLSSTISAGLDSATTTVDGLTLTFTASNGGVLDDYTNTGPNGIAIGAPANGRVNSDISGATNPVSGTYTLSFSQQVTSLSLSFGFLSDIAAPAERISTFMIGSAALPAGSVSFSGLSDVSTLTDANGDVLEATSRIGAGTISYSGAAFSSFSFAHTQAGRNLGFVVTQVSATPVPLPAGLPLLMIGIAALGLARRGRAA